MPEQIDLRRWATSRAAAWREVVEKSLAPKTPLDRGDVEQALATLEAYRGVARDLATARRVAPRSSTTGALAALYSQLHALVNRKPRAGLAAVRDALLLDAPRAAHAVAGRALGMAALMILSAFAGWWLINRYPTLAGLVASTEMIENVEEGKLWTDGLLNVVPSSVLSVGIFANNIAVSILAFCAGIFFGLGTFYLVAVNGFMLGAVFAFVHQHALAAALFRFIIAHGPVELSVICIAGAAGVALGESIIRPTLGSRRDSFQAAAHRLVPLLMLCALLLVGCGLIEGFISPDPTVPLWSRLLIGPLYWFVMLMLLAGPRSRVVDEPQLTRRRRQKFS